MLSSAKVSVGNAGKRQQQRHCGSMALAEFNADTPTVVRPPPLP